jgi:Xaa-Pro aminopeptidase
VEILEIEKVCALQDRIFAELVDRVKPGMREYEVSAIARYIGEREGSEQALYLIGSAPQNQAALLRNRHWQGRTINQGDYLNILIENNGAGGYYGEFLRTIVFGPAAPAIAEAFHVAYEAQNVIAGLLREGAPPGALAEANDDFLAARGLPVEDRLFAHGQGYDLVERPLLRGDEPMQLEQGMNISIHPAVRGPNIYISLCDNFLVTKGGGKRLHKTEHRLFEI